MVTYQRYHCIIVHYIVPPDQQFFSTRNFPFLMKDKQQAISDVLNHLHKLWSL